MLCRLLCYLRVNRCSVRFSYGAFSMSANGEPTRVSHEFVKKNMVRDIRPYE